MKIWAKTREFSEGKFLVVRRDGTVPAWPHFVLGARDPAAPAAMRAYADAMDALGRAGEVPEDYEYTDSIRSLSADFELYRKNEGDGDANAAPHRTDDPAVIEAMRGHPSTINVRPSANERKARP